jgi:ABC-2 type transport system permease protein
VNTGGLVALTGKELLRFRKVWLQTVLAPVLTALLYFVIFSHVLANRVQVFPGVSYTAFLIPGLMMMSVIQNAFANSSSSLIQSKITGNLVFVLVSPISPFEFFLAFVASSMVRGAIVGLGIFVATAPIAHLPVNHPFVLIMFTLLGAAALGALGIVAGLWADKFDQLAGFQNFIVVPLSFLSGVFYSIHSLPTLWLGLSRLNPFFYMIDGFRYGFFGVSDVSPGVSLAATAAFVGVLSALAVGLLARGYKIRN